MVNDVQCGDENCMAGFFSHNRFVVAKKVGYLVDTGLARAVTPKSDASRGWFLENLVYLALRRGDNRIE